MILYKQWSTGAIVGLIFYVLFVALTTYDTECLVKGNCVVWSWIRTVLYTFFPTIILIFIIVALIKRDKEALLRVQEENNNVWKYN
jgi:uncharacterized membrane protein (DUF485 family)